MEEEIMFRLRKAMEDKQMTATELSRLSGVGKSDISYYLNGRYKPKQDKCYMLANALGVDPGWLMTGVKPDEPSTKELMEELNKLAEMEEDPDITAVSTAMYDLPKEQREQISAMVLAVAAQMKNQIKEG